MRLFPSKSLISIWILLTFISTAYADESAVDTANDLNALYKRTADCDHGEPSYYCSGLILRGQLFRKEITEPWYLRSDSDSGSFSYIRSDVTALKGLPLYFTAITGYILTPLDEVQSKNQYAYKPACFIPWDGFTFGTASCHQSMTIDDTCTNLGIVTLSQFFAKYLDSDPSAFAPNTSGQHACSFSPDYDGFKLGISVDKYIYRDHPELGLAEGDDSEAYNEMVIGSWPKDKVSADHVPLKAIFITINDGGLFAKKVDNYDNPVSAAFAAADAYKKATNRDIAVVTLDVRKMHAGETDIFSPAIRP